MSAETRNDILGRDIVEGDYIALHGLLRMTRVERRGDHIFLDYTYDGQVRTKVPTLPSSPWNMRPAFYFIQEEPDLEDLSG